MATSTKFYNLVDTPAKIEYSQNGEGRVTLDPNAGIILGVSRYCEMSVMIGQTGAKSAVMFMGKLNGTTQCQSFSITLGTINTFKVVGPEMSIILMGGKPNSTEKVPLGFYG
jgi:hypothetical protein